jgi:hypothetical protein
MDPSRNSRNPAPVRTRYRTSPPGVVVGLLVLLLAAGTMRAETPENSLGSAEGIASLNRKENPDLRKTGNGVFTNALLGADAAVRVLDTYSTMRMLHNRCNGDPSVRVCNEEMFLPDAITHSKATMYSYEGAVWFAETLAVHKLAKHHRRLARLIPAVDIGTTLPFAVNNLRLPLN